MKLLKTGLFASLLAVVPFVHADDQQDAALSLMAINSGSASLVNLAPEVRSISTGVITEVELDDYKDTLFAYKFKVVDLAEGYKHKMSYSVQDGALLEHKSESLTTLGFSDLDDDERYAIEQVQKADFDILKKLTELEDTYSAKALEVELESKKGIVFYEVELASTEQGKQKLLINVATGEEIPVMKNKKHK
ncbi:PepSY domain-containing protein [Vibrio comitans]